MDQEVEAAPLPGQLGEGRIDAGRVGRVAGQHDLGADRVGERADAALQRLAALEGDGHLRALLMAGLGDAPGDRALVGDAHDEALFSGHQLSSYGHGSFLAGDGNWDKMPVA